MWPLSIEERPKQFLPLMGERTLFQHTALRAAKLFGADRLRVVCGETHQLRAAAELDALDLGRAEAIIAEPAGRNTAAAIALAAKKLAGLDEDPVLAVLPADHWIEDVDAFGRALRRASAHAGRGSIVALGVVPDEPNVAYGYIERGVALEDGAYRVDRFVEKPDAETARGYLDSGRFYWNAGIFVFRASTMLAELTRFQPEIDRCVEAFLNGDRDAYAAAPSISIDYAVMEETDKAVVVPADFGWSDLGDWNAVGERARRDHRGNAARGETWLRDCRNTFIHATHRPVAGIGLDSLVVVETEEAVLVVDKSKSQEVRAAAAAFADRPRQPALAVEERPWGAITVLAEGEDFKTKRLDILPGKRLSLQLHRRRTEYWVVVQGVAKVTCGEKQFLMSPGESTVIPVGARHRVENVGDQVFSLIEVQLGDYFGEDDIVRFEDDYGRVANEPAPRAASLEITPSP